MGDEKISSVGEVRRMPRPDLQPERTRDQVIADAHASLRSILGELEANGLENSPLAHHLRGMIEAYLHGAGYR